MRTLRALLLITIILIAFYWKLVFSNQYSWADLPDFAHQLLPWYQFQAAEWHAGRLPLWTPYEWGGQSLIGQGQPGVVDPINWLLYAAPLKRGWIAQVYLHWFYVLGHIFAGWTFFAFARSLGRSRAAAIAAALVYSLGGIAGSIEWPQMMHATVWAPLVFLYQFRALQGPFSLRAAFFSGFFCGVMWLSGHHQIPLYVTLGWGLLWLYHAVTRRPDPSHSWPRVRLFALAAVALAVMFCASAAQTLPLAEYGRHAIRWVGTESPLRWDQPVPYSLHEPYALRPLGLIAILFPGVEQAYQPFLGLTALSLAFLGLVRNWAFTPVRWLAALGLGGLLYSLGQFTLVHGVFYSLFPLVEKARVAAVAESLTGLAVAALAAYGLDSLSPQSLWQSRLARALLLLGGLTFAFAVAAMVLRHIAWNSDTRWILSGLAALALAWLFRQPHPPAAAFGALALFELALSTGYYWRNTDQKDRPQFLANLKAHSDIAQFLQQRPGLPRVEHDLDAVPFSFGDWFGLETFEGFTPSAPANLWSLNPFERNLRRLYSVQYAIGKKAPSGALREIFTSRSGLKVFEYPDPLPRLWMVHQVRQAESFEQAHDWMVQSDFAPTQSAFLLETPPALEACSTPADLQFTQRLPGRLRIQAETACRGLLIVNDTFDPGWQASVDGKPARLYAAYGMLRGVVLERGKHSVEMRYRPSSFLTGASLTLATAIAAMVLAVLGHGHRRRV
jgi:hypothetical protein